MSTKALLLSLVVEAEDEGFLACCPDIQGAFAEGDTIEEAILNCVDVIKMIAAYWSERGESIGLNTLELAPAVKVAVSIPVGIAA